MTRFTAEQFFARIMGGALLAATLVMSSTQTVSAAGPGVLSSRSGRRRSLRSPGSLGLLPWLFFNRVLSLGVDSLVLNGALIQKVYFPRIVLPLSLANATFFTWLLEMGVLVVAFMFLGAFVLPWLPVLLVVMIVFALFAVGLAMIVSIVNVYFRDLSYLLTIVLQFWFYLTPILYPIDLVATQSERLGGLFGTPITLLNLYQVNPVEGFIEIFRNVLYDNAAPEASTVLIALGWTVLSLGGGLLLYAKKEKQMAELL
jgi:ABC-2 type transport system permease protein